MGALRAIITTLISFYLVNLLYNNKDKIKKYPFLKYLIPYLDKSKSYIIILFMIIIMVVW